jgi:predicted dehydrogenase
MSTSTLNGTKTLRLGIIGCGMRIAHMAQLLCQHDANVRISAIADVDAAGAADRARVYQLDDGIRYFSSAQEMLAGTGDLDGLLIGTPCHLHAPLAVEVAATGLPLFLEKPVAITWEQLRALQSAYAGREQSVVVSFPLRVTAQIRTAVDIIRSGRLGTINQLQAVNNVPYGGVYFGQWFRDYQATGGLWLQKATHDFDYMNQLLRAATPDVRPIRISAMHSRTVYGGELPPDLHCKACERTATCPESPQNLVARNDDGGILNYQTPTLDSDHACAFSSSILHQDAGSALIMYSNGVHASYAQNFIPRRSAGFRGATLIGYNATLRFNWTANTLTVIDHHRDHVERMALETRGPHAGGDEALAKNFIDVLHGRDGSRATLDDGLLSAAMCLAARDAAATTTVQSIPPFGSVTGPVNLAPRGPIEPVLSETH